jgi:predicted AAA+ superfamily ATPase
MSYNLQRYIPRRIAVDLEELIKIPKIYIRDSGILHALLEIENTEDLLRNTNEQNRIT